MSRPQSVYLMPRTMGQAEVIRAFEQSDVLIITGSAGCGKTHLAMAQAAMAINDKRYQRVILSRPQVTAGGEQMGFLPGKVEQKMHPWLLPIHDVLRSITWTKPDEWIKQNTEIVPLGFMRGRTFDRAIAVLDEAQNATYAQLKLFLSRLGHKGKLILTGDPAQSDLPDYPCGLQLITDYLTNPPLPGVTVCRLGMADVVRHPLLASILERI